MNAINVGGARDTVN